MSRLSRAASILLVFLFLVPAGQSSAANGPIVALFDIQDKGASLPAPTLESLIDILAAKLAQGGYQVVPRDQIKKGLREVQTESFKACYDQSCQIELGRELAAQKTLSTQIIKLGASCQVTASLYDLKKAATELAATSEAKCDDEASMLEAFKSIAAQLVQPFQESKRAAEGKLSDLAALLKDEKTPRPERLQKAWSLTRQIAEDTMLAEPVREETLRNFLAAFPTDNPHQAEAQKLLAPFSPSSLVVRSEPAGALVSIDGKPIGPAPVTKELKSKEYQVEVSLDGYLTKRQKVVIETGKQTDISLTLEPPPTHSLNIWGHVTFWTGLTLALGGGAAAVPMMLEWDDYEKAGDSGAKERSDQFHTLMIAGLGAGGALLAAGIILWIIEPSPIDWARELNERASVSAIPTPGGAGLVLQYTGRL